MSLAPLTSLNASGTRSSCACRGGAPVLLRECPPWTHHRLLSASGLSPVWGNYKVAANICVEGLGFCVGNHMGWLAFRLLWEEGHGVGGGIWGDWKEATVGVQASVMVAWPRLSAAGTGRSSPTGVYLGYRVDRPGADGVSTPGPRRPPLLPPSVSPGEDGCCGSVWLSGRVDVER